MTVQSQGLKKKGPGMPPGPIIPGKHNMDIGTWDTAKPTPPQLPIANNAPAAKAMVPQSTVPIRPSWNGPPTNRAPSAQPRPGLPQHPIPTPYQPQTMMPPPHLPPTVNLPAGGHVQGLIPGTAIPVMVAPPVAPTHPVLDELRGKNNYNPTDFDISAPNARFFVIKVIRLNEYLRFYN